jgi:hypothetical protein
MRPKPTDRITGGLELVISAKKYPLPMFRDLTNLLPETDQPFVAMLLDLEFMWAIASSIPASAIGISDAQVCERAVSTL